VADGSWSLRTRLLFLALVVFWALNYPFVNYGLDFAGPLWLATLRAATGAAATIPIVIALGGHRSLDRAGIRDALLLGVPNTALFFGAWFVAAQSVLPGTAAVVIYTFPLWVAVLSPLVLSQRLTAVHWLAVAAGFGGVALISQIGEGAAVSIAPLPIALLLAAAFSWAVGTVLIRRRFRSSELLQVSALQLVGGTAALLIATLLLAPTPLPVLAPGLGISLLWMGVLGTGAAYAIWFDLLGRTSAARLSAFVFLVPVVALAASVFYFGERLADLQIVGVVLVLLSIFGISREPLPKAPSGAGAASSTPANAPR